MKTKFKKGLTLIELMTAVATGSFVILAAGMVMTFGQQSWNNEWKRACLQRETSYLMTEITQPIRGAWAATVDDANSKSIVIYNGDDSISFNYVPGQHILRKSINDGIKINLSNKVQTLGFTASGKKVTTNLTLRVDDIQASATSTVMMRNYGG